MRTFAEFVSEEVKNLNSDKIEFINALGQSVENKEIRGKYEIATDKGPFRVWITITIDKNNKVLETKVSHVYYNDDYTQINDVKLNFTPVMGFYEDGWYGKHNIAYKIEGFEGLYAPCEKGYITNVSPLKEEDHIKLSNGNVLMNKFGKYEPNLCFICAYPHIIWEDIEAKDLNLDRGDFKCLHGEFFVSKKGTKCFRIKKNGQHILLRDNWGGAFNNYRGGTLPEEGALYYRRASSNGGGSGYDYAIYNSNWQFQLSEEDI